MQEPERVRLYFRYLIERGSLRRWGPDWRSEVPEREFRLSYESRVIEEAGYCAYFLILARILEWCREQRIVTGPGRGSVGGSLAAYCLGIHELDSLRWDLSFERFLNPERVSLPDVDLDVSRRHRDRVLAFIREEFEDEHTAVLQIPAFARAGARRTIDMVLAAKRQDDPQADAVAEQLRKLLPDKGSVTGGMKVEKEIEFWLENGRNSRNQQRFRELAEKAGWMELLSKLDGIQTHLAKHAAGVVILSREDLARMPQTSVDGVQMMAGYDMYSLDDFQFLKIDILGLRNLDVVSDAHRACGGDGTTPALMELWELERDGNVATYDLLGEADTLGVFQSEASGYRKFVKDFRPKVFDHIVQLNALNRPGTLDAKREDGKNMLEIFIDRMHGRESIVYPSDLRDVLSPILDPTQGIIVFQEQAMRIAVDVAGFTPSEADNLRKAIGKKQLDRMRVIEAQFREGMDRNGYSENSFHYLWDTIQASARYQFNLAHAFAYSIITWWTAYFKANPKVEVPSLDLEGYGKTAFYAALINSLEEDKERQADAVAEARQHVTIRPPDINIAEDSYTVDGDAVVFGLNGIKGMGEAGRSEILLERLLGGPYRSFEDFHRRLPSLGIDKKLSLVRCGALDQIGDRSFLLSMCERKGKVENREWTVAEFIKHNFSLKKPRPLPMVWEVRMPTERELAEGELNSVGFYLAHEPFGEITQALKRLDSSSHWGGEIIGNSIKVFNDKNGNAMARFTILATSLNKLRMTVFASNYPQCRPFIVGGERVVIRGSLDGSQVLVDRIFQAGRYDHHKAIRLVQNGSTEVKQFDGQLATIEKYEAEGWTVQLV